MAERAGKGPKAAWEAIHAAMPQAKLSGIVGDRAHKYGYHRGRNFVSSRDYSATQADDRAGPGEAASALDVTLSAGDMKLVTNRLISAVNKGDSRLQCLREFFGTTNGTSVTGRDVRTKNWVTSDKSHLWHVHLSFYRRWADDPTAAKKVAEVFTGKGSSGGGGSKPPPSGGGAKLRRAWPSYMKAGDYFGDIKGGKHSRGGANAYERPDVKAIQQRLIKLGYVPGVKDPNSKWADGKFEKPTKDAVTRWQKAKYASSTSRYGEVWHDDWNHLFTY